MVITAGQAPAASIDSWGDQKNRIGFNALAAFNIEANFRNLGGFPAQTDPGPATGSVNHFYDNGYNRVDVSGNANSTTWYWGYDSPSQLSGNTLTMSSTSARSSGQVNGVGDDPHWGGEVVFAREIGWSSSYWWGFQVAVGYLDLRFRNDGSFVTDATRTSDSYSLGGIVVPDAPYRGTYEGPGPLLGDTPTRQIVTLPGAALTSGTYELDASVYSLRLGLLFETPFADWVTLQFGGGAMGDWVRSDFSYEERTTINAVGDYSSSRRESEGDFVFGAYAEVNLAISINRRLSAVVGGQYQFLSEYEQALGEQTAEIEFKNALLVSVGLNFAF